MLRGKGPRGLQAASMAAGQTSNPNLMGQHIVIRLRPGASKVGRGHRGQGLGVRSAARPGGLSGRSLGPADALVQHVGGFVI